jgi:hypothetical protein
MTNSIITVVILFTFICHSKLITPILIHFINISLYDISFKPIVNTNIAVNQQNNHTTKIKFSTPFLPLNLPPLKQLIKLIIVNVIIIVIISFLRYNL